MTSMSATGASAERFPWTAEGVVEHLTVLWTEKGLSAGSIADDLAAHTGVPIERNAVMGKLRRLGLMGKGARSKTVAGEGTAESPAPAAAAPPSEPVRSASDTLNSPATAVSPPADEPVRPVQASVVEAAEPSVERLPFQSPAPAAKAPEPLRPDGYALVDLRIGQCRYAVTGFGTREHRFCGAPVEGASSWCAEHAEAVFDRTPAAQRRSARIAKLIGRKAA